MHCLITASCGLFFGAAVALLCPLLQYVAVTDLKEPSRWEALYPMAEVDIRGDGIVYWILVVWLSLNCLLAVSEFLYSLWVYPIGRVEHPVLKEVVEERRQTHLGKLFVRIVTKGNNPKLVGVTVRAAEAALANVPADMWAIEVITGKSNDLPASDNDVREIVCPKDYETPRGTKYKAKSLHYAIEQSRALACDWIVHLDEETQFDGTTVANMLQHCNEQDGLLKSDKTKQFGNIAQGFIHFGTSGNVENWITTLMDSFRVGYDQALLRWQYARNTVWLGMHGSFFLVHNAVEQHIGFDCGPTGSICEDTYWCFKAAGEGVEFSFINGNMYEESPFTVMDFIWQRERWSRGLMLVVGCWELPMSRRLCLGTFASLWITSGTVAIISIFTTVVYPDGILGAIIILTALCNIWPYFVGFILQYHVSGGFGRYCLLAFGQLLVVPIGIYLEATSPLLGLFFIAKSLIMADDNKGFYVVRKRNNITAAAKNNSSNKTA